MNLTEKAMEAISEVFNDTSVPRVRTLENLEELQIHLGTYLDNLHIHDDDDDDDDEDGDD